MKKLIAVMCAVLVLGGLAPEAQARRGELRRNNGNRGEGRRGEQRRGERRRNNGNRDGRRADRHRGDQGRGRDRNSGRIPDRRPPHDSDYGRTTGPRNPNRDIGRNRRPNRPHRPVMDRPARPVRRNDGYRRHVHRPHRNARNYSRRYDRPYDYDRTIPFRFVYRNRWIRFSVGLGNGFTDIDGYPYYVFNGYRHRYSYYDTCDYDLVDSYSDLVTQTFYGYTCAEGYDDCADLRDDFNYDERENRYFCAERMDPQWQD